MTSFLKTVDMTELGIPENVLPKKKSVKVSEGFKVVEGIKVFFRESDESLDKNPDKVSLLLLHGQSFSSKTWLELGTIQTVGAMGYRAVAVDLPGYGNSPPASISDRAKFLNSLIEIFGLNKPVIVSPSMSGSYALPFLLKYHERLAGYIPVAPVGAQVLEKVPPIKLDEESIIRPVYEPLKGLLPRPIPDLTFIKTPTLIVFGERDRSRSSALLSLLPNSQAQEVPKGGHAAYLDNPDLWHKLLYNFLHHLSTSCK